MIMTKNSLLWIAALSQLCVSTTTAFTATTPMHPFGIISSSTSSSPSVVSLTQLNMSPDSETVAAPHVTGEELELLLTDFEIPLVVDAYATWCGPCLLMAPEFEAAAKELEGRVKFVKLDTDEEPEMAGRLNIMGLPTLLFLDKLPEDQDGNGAKAVLKDRIEGALRKESIVAVCEFLFFDGPKPTQL